ncbi:Clavaminate synthase-like protein [Ganoderma leucocontextum]|nr:Clavaminate synthase-like protein [Ganoderma leucocontextum]
MSAPRRPLVLAGFRTDSTFEDIPIINLKNAKSDDPTVRKALAEEIRDACINVGFFYGCTAVKNHGISEAAIAGAVEAAKQFFALPLSTKMELDIHKSPNFKGYTALLGENTNPENRGDLHEGFDIGWEDPTGSSRVDDGAMTGQNIWPTDMPGIRDAALEYYHSAIRVGQSLFPLFALALDLPETFFGDKTTKPAAIMRLLYYPPQTGPVDNRLQGIGAHTDYECFTILWQQEDIQALQVLNANGTWVNAVPIPGTLVVNLGDQFARWTNDVFKSTVHRAINRSGVERYSIPLFFGTDYDVKLEALPSCVSDDYPAQYEVVTAGEYVKSRLEATYAHSKT